MPVPWRTKSLSVGVSRPTDRQTETKTETETQMQTETQTKASNRASPPSEFLRRKVSFESR